MASVRSKKHASKDPSFRDLKADYYPVQRSVQLGSTTDAAPHKLVDVGRTLSVVNHRLYRQGKTYQVKLDLDTESNAGKYTVWALVDTWYIQKAWQLARATYERTMADERASMGPTMAARWEDFRVDAGVPGIQVATPYRYNSSLVGAQDSDGEFLSSRITLSDGVTQRTFSWGTTAGASLGMLSEYDKFDNTNVVSKSNDLAYAGVDDETSEAAADDLKGRGDFPPYNENNFSSSVWVKIATLDTTASGSPTATARLSTGFFNAPCGLIVVETPTPNTALAGQLTMTVKAGSYKGVAGMNMGV